MPKYRTADCGDDRRTAKRVYIIGAVMACCFGVLICRAVSFRLKDNELLENTALRQYRTAVSQSTKRGKILDAKGRELAIDVTIDSVFANPPKVKEPVKVAEVVAKILGVDRRKLLDRLSSKRKFVWVKRKVGESEAGKIKELNIEGISIMRENDRFYPGNALAASILGAVGFDSEPLGGVELYHNDQLSAQSGHSKFMRDAKGHLYLSPTDEKDSPLANIELTIDRTIQYTTEKQLEHGVRASKAKGGTAIVVDVNSGELLAMANFPSFDPNNYSSYPISQWRNMAVVDSYEPGSTFKVIVIASALDSGIVKSDDIFDCENGRIRVGNHMIGDAHPHGKLSVADIVKVSSNIGAYKIESQLSREQLYNSIRSFGFGIKTDIDLPGESTGILSPSERWSELQHATIAFGQGMAATPLQMAMAFATIANGGKLLKPYIVKRIVNDKGAELFVGQRSVVGDPIQPSTAALMTYLLTRVVEKGGTGTLAASAEYKIAGKTGTAQKADPRTGGYADGKYYSSFIGFAPADRPRIAVYVGLDEPRGQFYYGGQVAAPIFRDIVESTLHYLKVPGKVIVASEDVMKQMPPREAEGELALVELARRDSSTDVDLEKFVVRDGDAAWRIPDLTGLTMRGVLEASGNADIDWRFEGSGVAVKQSVKPGNTVPSHAVCRVEFKPLM